MTALNRLHLIDTIKLSRSSIVDLRGINSFQNLTCLYLHNNRTLQDISELKHVSRSLKALRIESCSKIQDFSVLENLENLQLLQLSGGNELPSLSFLKGMKNLRTSIFNMNVLDGDLSLCRDLSYVYAGAGRKHYNVRVADLPRNQFIRGNEDIEEWRRLE